MPTIQRHMEDVRVEFVSLVDKAANKREFLIRAAADGREVECVQIPVFNRGDLTEDSTRYVTGIVYEPGAVDTHGRQMTAREIAKMARAYMRNCRSIDIQHNGIQAEGCFVAESAIANSDCTIGGQHVPAGAWYMTVGIDNPEIAAKVDSGELNGLSFAGMATVVTSVANADFPNQMGAPQAPAPPQPQAEKDADGEGETKGMFQQILAVLRNIGQRLGIGSKPQQLPAAPMGGPQNSFAVRNAQDAENKTHEEVHKTMTREEYNAVSDNIWNALVDQGVGVKPETAPPAADSQPNATPVANSAGTAAPPAITMDDIRMAIREEIAAVGTAKEAGVADTQSVANAANEEAPAAVTLDDLRGMVREEVGALRDTINRAYGTPTNGNGTPVQNSAAKPHYMDGFFRE